MFVKLSKLRNNFKANFLLNYWSMSFTTGEFKVSDQKYLTACCVSDEINIRMAKNYFKKFDIIKELNLPIEISKITYGAQYKSGNEGKRFFIFNGGVISFWNMNFNERLEIINLTKPFQINAISDYIKEEDELPYFLHDDKTKISKEIIYLKISQTSEQEEKLIEQQMALSEALSQSVKLGIYESQFETFSASINIWIDQLKSGTKWRIKETEVLKKTGELFTMRHKINVSSHLTEIPDIYWQKSDLEHLFDQIRRDLNIYSRIKILNEKLNLYNELTEVLRNHIAFMHSTKLELMIIALILVEVIFECISFYERYSVNGSEIAE